MRLTCPNCGAQYEVPDEVIPETGRDVQCSNCGDTWFQHHPDHMPDPDEDEAAGWDAPPDEDQDDDEAEADLVDDPVPDEVTARDEEDAGQLSDARRKVLDPSVADVLRAEAERERAVRNAEHGSGLEIQPELGLGAAAVESDKRGAEAQVRMARLRGEPDAALPDEDEGPSPGTRRSLLPDIDEINSSLSSDGTIPGSAQPDDDGDPADARGAGGFRRGFRTVILLALLGLVLYVFAPQIGQTVPALEVPLAKFVALVDAGRTWLDQMIGEIIAGTE